MRIVHWKAYIHVCNKLWFVVGVLLNDLENGKTADEFAEVFKEAVSPITGEDEIILLGDLIGGSPLTTALNVINEKGLTDNTVVLGGMNLPLAFQVAMEPQGEYITVERMREMVEEAKNEIKYVNDIADDGDDEDE